ncbi:TetR/AcrR family transcriptional regulator [Flavimobilis sp. GY10621]|uniref:TetR/AcrR family transcriptional regulator n=1 Tax=Flavimobilis rhizosphaerae TaxID=2775421 RepID=A0ABR9DU96_9MICO|nr:TetR/AcrR family transcriptional regulator [Flavimobilis rhizosphaerae]MBD9699912.1 TetR/AcrR family transcriptional regulator [Flavimobilis rhizosphaerae]
MSSEDPRENDASDIPRRAPRLSSDQSRARVLASALSMLETTGLTVSLEHLSIEDLIRAADVPRSAFYRLWPSKDLFYADLLEHITIESEPSETPFDPTTLDVAAQTLQSNIHRLGTPDGRRAVTEEMLRLAGRRNIDALTASASWRDAFALVATINGVADPTQRENLVRALKAGDERRTQIMAAQYTQLLALLGCGLQPGVTAETLARVGARIIEGFAQGQMRRPDLDSTMIMRPGLDGEPVAWHPAALALWGAFQLLIDFDGPARATAPGTTKPW